MKRIRGLRIKIYLSYVWFLENTKERKKMQRKWIFYIWLSYEKYQRKSNIIKINKKIYVFLNYLMS